MTAPTATLNAVLVAKCIGCGATKEISVGEVKADDHPMCGLCFMPMVAYKAKVKHGKRHR